MLRANLSSCLTVFALLSGGISAQQVQTDLVLGNAVVIDGTGGQPLPNASILIAAGKIERIASGLVEVPAGTRVIDLRGAYVLPGFIDAHVHLRDVETAQRALQCGVTTARSMGVSHFVDVGLRDLIAAGHVEGPEILAAGYHVRPRPAEGLFVDFPRLGNLMPDGVRGPEPMRRVARALLERQIDFIKTTATERAGLPETDPRKQLYDEEELRALVEEGAAAGVPVAAHAHGDEGANAAVRAGVRSIEHGTYLSDETLGLMAERGTFLVPTIAIVGDVSQPGGSYDQPALQVRGRHMLPRVRETAAKAHAAGVRIVAATDTGYGPESVVRMSQEIEELVGVGLSPMEAIQSATLVAAELLGVADHTGRLTAGLDADLIVVERNPLEEIGALHDLLLVVNNGTVVRNRVTWSEGRR